jgi:hypothetical protein
MAKKIRTPPANSELQDYLDDIESLSALPVSGKFKKLVLPEYPFDAQLLSASKLYRESRKLYLSLGGVFTPTICSTMRSLSAQDLFKDEISFTPAFSEILWFKDHHHEVSDPVNEIKALSRFSEISIYHEQNHRVLWRLLPPAPKEERDFCRYLNFAESLVVMLDLALGDELGARSSPLFERLKVIYRPGGEDTWFAKTKAEYRNYLLAILSTTYFALEILHNDDIPAAVDYLFPGQRKMTKNAVRRGLELSELFSRVTNPEWQGRYWKSAQIKLRKLHTNSEEDTLYLPEDPLDLEAEFYYAHRVFDYYGL